MKTNAIIRIVLWSIVILILLIPLLSVIPTASPAIRAEATLAATEIPVPLNEAPALPVEDEAEKLNLTAAVVENLNIRSAPSEDASAIGLLQPGDTVTIGRQENINGEAWAYISAPNQGWVQAKYLNTEPVTSTGPVTNYDAALDPKQIREIDIEWAAGDIIIRPAEVDSIQITETAEAATEHIMQWKQSGDKLIIRFSEKNFTLNVGFSDTISKDLTILVPVGFEFDSLEVDAGAAALTVTDQVIREVDFDGGSGKCDLMNCVIGELDLDTASGEIYFTGSLEALDCDAASASVIAVFNNVPRRIDMDSMSGDLDITLPDTAGFTVTMDAMSSDFVSDFGYSQNKDGSYYRGDGACKISMDAMSGDVYVRRAMESDASPASTNP